VKFISDTLDIMDKHKDMRRFYFIMNYTPIHILKEIEAMAKERNSDYKYVFVRTPSN
jgi:hypothetical protein